MNVNNGYYVIMTHNLNTARLKGKFFILMHFGIVSISQNMKSGTNVTNSLQAFIRKSF